MEKVEGRVRGFRDREYNSRIVRVKNLKEMKEKEVERGELRKMV